jgi:hypothetical protein
MHGIISLIRAKICDPRPKDEQAKQSVAKDLFQDADLSADRQVIRIRKSENADKDGFNTQ